MTGRKNGCSGKVRYSSQTGAVRALIRLKNARLQSYPCTRCGGWHVGGSSSPYRVAARIDQLLSEAKAR